jgi:hypothetical protein
VGKIRLEGKGSAQLQIRGKRLLFRDVYYILVLQKNILSISWIVKHSPHLDVVLSDYRCFIVDKKRKKDNYYHCERTSLVSIGGL